MFCYKCGCKIEKNQKFCGKCGVKLDEIEISTENQENIQTQTDNINEPIKYGLSSLTKKIITVIVCIFVIALTAFGIVQFRQYQKDIEPYETKLSFVEGDDIICKLTYDNKNKMANLSMLHKGIIIEQWQIDYFSEDNISYDLNNKSEDTKYKFDFKNYEFSLNKPLVVNFVINNIDNSKEFVQLKEKFDSLDFSRSIPKALSENEKIRTEIKNNYLKQKEEERKHKEWQEKVLSNCVYKTSDGVCFTTEIFEVDPMRIKIGSFWSANYWLGAKDMCESKGYRLPSDVELRSLFKDIVGFEISKGIDIKTYKYSNSKTPINYNVLKKIAPKGFVSYTTSWDNVNLWENEEFDDDRAYYRNLKTWGDEVSYQSFISIYVDNRAICVYDANGKPKKSLVKEQKEKINAEREQQKSQQQFEKGAEDALF